MMFDAEQSYPDTVYRDYVIRTEGGRYVAESFYPDTYVLELASAFELPVKQAIDAMHTALEQSLDEMPAWLSGWVRQPSSIRIDLDQVHGWTDTTMAELPVEPVEELESPDLKAALAKLLDGATDLPLLPLIGCGMHPDGKPANLIWAASQRFYGGGPPTPLPPSKEPA